MKNIFIFLLILAASYANSQSMEDYISKAKSAYSSENYEAARMNLHELATKLTDGYDTAIRPVLERYSPDRVAQFDADLADLIYAGLLHPGMPLVPRSKKYAHRVATLLPDGQLDLEGRPSKSRHMRPPRSGAKPPMGCGSFSSIPRRGVP